MKTTTKIKLAWVLIIVSAILFILHFVFMDYIDANWKDYFGPLSNVLLILAMVISIRDMKTKK
ncbi:MAG: hypothetical protein PSN34_05125 [Urechidicola sp.]|nr:hypothetical protein [Urechidicola sp.]